MKKTAVAVAALMMMSLAGCSLEASTGLRVKSPVKVEVEGSKHCPPGQAKKGNC